MNLIYMGFSAVLIPFQLYTYKRKDLAWLSQSICFLIGVRANLRLLDFENTKFLLNSPDEPGRMDYEEWVSFLIGSMQLNGLYSYITILNFQNIRGNMFIVATQTLITMICAYTTWTTKETPSWQIIIPSFLVTSAFLVFVWFNHGSNTDFLKETEKLVDANSLFKTIFDNLREAVMLIQDNQVVYVNDMLLDKFRTHIHKAQVTLRETEAPPPKGFKQKVRRCFCKARGKTIIESSFPTDEIFTPYIQETT